MRKLAAILTALAVYACVAPEHVPPARMMPPVAPPPPRRLSEPGLERVIGKTAREIEAWLGKPTQDLREPRVRRLQFVGATCVLDAYLYAPRPGAEPVVTWVDARLSNGEEVDRAACVAELMRGR